MNPQRWRPAELARLGAYIAQGAPDGVISEIAAAIGRSYKAVENKLFSLRVAAGTAQRRVRGVIAAPARDTGTSRGRPFSAAEDELIRTLRHAKLAYRRIGELIGRSETTVAKRFALLAESDADPAPDPQPIKRQCLMCRVWFTQDRALTNFFRCELHRGMSDWLAGEGSTGHKRGAKRDG